jgi:hypothetical protein
LYENRVLERWVKVITALRWIHEHVRILAIQGHCAKPKGRHRTSQKQGKQKQRAEETDAFRSKPDLPLRTLAASPLHGFKAYSRVTRMLWTGSVYTRGPPPARRAFEHPDKPDGRIGMIGISTTAITVFRHRCVEMALLHRSCPLRHWNMHCGAPGSTAAYQSVEVASHVDI